MVSMNGMRKRNGLDGLVPDPVVFRGEIVIDAVNGNGPDEQTAREQSPGELVGPLWKNVRHRWWSGLNGPENSNSTGGTRRKSN